MELITAVEAKRQTDKIIQENTPEALRTIMKLINGEIQQGRYELNIPKWHMNNIVIEKLRSLGYHVSFFDIDDDAGIDETIATISWNKEG